MSTIATRWASQQKTGSPTSKLVLLVLADRADKSGHCWPSARNIAATCELCERAVRLHIDKLQKSRKISVTRRMTSHGQTSNGYQLNIPREVEQTVTDPTALHSGGVHQVLAEPALPSEDALHVMQGLSVNHQVDPPLKDRGACAALPLSGRGEELKQLVGAEVYRVWFSDAEFSAGPPPTILAGSEFKCSRIRGHYLRYLRQMFGEDVCVNFRRPVVTSELAPGI
jgi:hypothetical protein